MFWNQIMIIKVEKGFFFCFIIVSFQTDHIIAIIQLPISSKGCVMKIVGMFQILLTLFCKLDGEALLREKNWHLYQ